MTLFATLAMRAAFAQSPLDQVDANPPSDRFPWIPQDESGVQVARAVVYTARIPIADLGDDDQCEQFARQHGSIEVITFARSDGPEKFTGRTLINLGEEPYDCAGMTVWVRKSLEADQRAGRLVLGDTATSLRSSDPNGAQTVDCQLSSTKGDPIRATVYVSGTERLSVVQTEVPSATGGPPWPARCVIRVPGRGAIVQVLDYDDAVPPPTAMPTVSGILREKGGGDDYRPPLEQGTATDTVSFAYTWGPSWTYDTKW
jgi:hypothetical protein